MMTTEQKVNSIAGSFAIEGMILTEEEKESCRKIIDGETTIDDEIAKLNEKYKGVR